MSAVVPPPVRSGPDGHGPGVRSRRVTVVVLVVAAVTLLASVVTSPWIVRELSGSGSPSVRVAGPGGAGMMRGGPAPGGMMGGGMAGGGMAGRGMAGRGGMMSGRVWLAGDGVAVTSIAAARARATAAASASGLKPGEIVQFSGNFYVELKDSAGASVTEVLVDPVNGAVTTEPGPAMMWNTGSRTAAVSADQARSIAAAWLRANRPGEAVTSVDAYPGYYTLDTAAGERPVGMLSVNATSGEVWYHTWHGSFVAKEDA